MKYIYITFLLSILVNTKAFTQTTVSGTISKNVVWDISGSPYNIVSNVVVNQGVSVTIKPGVVLFSSSNTKIVINGELIAEGNKDSIIEFKSVETNFTKLSNDYNPLTGKGNRFSYCKFTNPAGKLSAYQVNLEKSAVRIDQSHFQDIYYCIYGGPSDSVKVWVSNTNFNNLKNSSGYPIYMYNTGTFLSLDNCQFSNYGNIYAAENNDIKNSYFRPFANNMVFYFSHYTKSLKFSCNLIRKAKLALDLANVSINGFKAVLQNNEFDSCGLVIQLSCSKNYDTIKVVGNNFRRFTQKNIEVVHAAPPNSIFKTLDFSGNYWITTDTNDILNTILDFRQNPKLIYKLNIDNFRTTPVNQCWPVIQGQTNSLFQHIKEPGVVIYPNPVNDKLTIKFDGLISNQSSAQILDITGKRIDADIISSASNEITLDTRNLNPGIYLLELNEKDNRVYKRFVKD